MCSETMEVGNAGSKTGRALVLLYPKKEHLSPAGQFVLFEKPGASKPDPNLHTISAHSQNLSLTAYISTNSDKPVYWAKRSDHSFAIVDGEIYEIDKGQSFAANRNPADEVLRAYSKFGSKIFGRIDMAASLVLWDAADEIFYVVRDRSGIVPSFFHATSTMFCWASNIWSLLRLTPASDFNYAAIDFFLANGFIPAPWTLIEGIEKIPPAHMLIVPSRGTFRLERYWPALDKTTMLLSHGERVAALEATFQRSLARRWRLPGPSAALLSGGMDSALVVAGLKRCVGGPLHTFTLGYKEYEGNADEREMARLHAEALGSSHHEIVFGPRDIINNHKAMVFAHGAPFTWGLRAFFLQEVYQSGFRALFGGDGPDSFYPSETDLKGNILRSVPLPIRRAIMDAILPCLRMLSPDIATKLSSSIWCANTGLPARCADRIMPFESRSSIYQDRAFPGQAAREALRVMQRHAAEYAGWPLLEKIVFLHLRYFVAENTLAFNHSWTTWHGLQYRAPFCDYDLIDIIFARPTPKSSDKDDFRKFAASFLGDRLAHARKVRTAIPITHWMRGPLREFVHDKLASREIEGLDLLDAEGIQDLLKQHSSGVANHGMKLWAILALVVWSQIVRDISKARSI